MTEHFSPLKDSDEGVTLAIRVTPKASRNAVVALERTSGGETVLKIKVTAPAEDGKANAAVIKLLAKAWKVPKSAISVASGAASRHKVLSVTCDADARKRIKDWLEGYRN